MVKRWNGEMDIRYEIYFTSHTSVVSTTKFWMLTFFFAGKSFSIIAAWES